MAFEIKIEVERIRSDRFSAKRLKAFRERINDILLSEMQLAVVMARSLVPIRTGKLQASITIYDRQTEGFYLWIEGGTEGVPYARFVEFGTTKMHARPFWRPPIWESFFRARESIREAFVETFK